MDEPAMTIAGNMFNQPSGCWAATQARQLVLSLPDQIAFLQFVHALAIRGDTASDTILRIVLLTWDR
jgi:hypothetical protein